MNSVGMRTRMERQTHSTLLPVSPAFSKIGRLGTTVGMGATVESDEVVGVGTSKDEVVLRAQTGSMMFAMSIDDDGGFS